jgi:hypothetical protein
MNALNEMEEYLKNIKNVDIGRIEKFHTVFEYYIIIRVLGGYVMHYSCRGLSSSSVFIPLKD